MAPALAISAAAAITATAVPAMAAPTAAAAKLPSVNYDATLLASQLDPGRPGTGTTSGAKASVLLVEKALYAKHLLAKKYVDGSFGSSTVKAMTTYQKKLGYTGCSANGIPGPTSLAKLGAGRFTVTNKISVGSTNSSYGGKRVNTRSKKMLAAADAKYAGRITLTQGEYHKGVGASAGTHDCGGAVDININGVSTTNRWKMVKALRSVGFAAWLRTPAQGFAYHIHAVAINDADLAPAAQPQVWDYYRGRNGLASHGADNTPKAYRAPFRTFEHK
ncbi:peptidoglycan-binding protein [Actinomadura barringtoniae]|uniref:Peptidoglycan-binding protein n=2 Tax=Actinomadura barringtoniae TaxID=1427535 RepID=A0A939PGI9_9ACTN|nr:peptidoglycan-binding protein [Actinomadura barringtoniae]